MIITPESDAERDLLYRRLPALRHILGYDIAFNLGDVASQPAATVLRLDRIIRTKLLKVSNQSAQQGGICWGSATIQPFKQHP